MMLGYVFVTVLLKATCILLRRPVIVGAGMMPLIG